MKVWVILKGIATGLILIVIDRVEFLYYAFEGNGKKVSFWCCQEPIAQSWWVQIESYYLQLFLFTLILLMWLPFWKHFIPVVGTFFLCMPEFWLTYGEPIAKLPLPFGWYIPVSVSALRMASVCYYLTVVVIVWFKSRNGNENVERER